MCKIRTGSELRNKEDIRSVITSMILRQKSRYSKEDIYACVKYCMEGAPNLVNEKTLEDMIERGLDIFCRSGEIRCRAGFYYPSSLIK